MPSAVEAHPLHAATDVTLRAAEPPPWLTQVRLLTGRVAVEAFRNPVLILNLLLALLFRTIESFNMFDLIYTITNGGPGTSTESVSTEIYDTAFVLFESGRASALGNLSVFVVIVLTRIYFRAIQVRKEAA